MGSKPTGDARQNGQAGRETHSPHVPHIRAILQQRQRTRWFPKTSKQRTHSGSAASSLALPTSAQRAEASGIHSCTVLASAPACAAPALRASKVPRMTLVRVRARRESPPVGRHATTTVQRAEASGIHSCTEKAQVEVQGSPLIVGGPQAPCRAPLRASACHAGTHGARLTTLSGTRYITWRRTGTRRISRADPLFFKKTISRSGGLRCASLRAGSRRHAARLGRAHDAAGLPRGLCDAHRRSVCSLERTDETSRCMARRRTNALQLRGREVERRQQGRLLLGAARAGWMGWEA
jgi:hypothetical protein